MADMEQNSAESSNPENKGRQSTPSRKASRGGDGMGRGGQRGRHNQGGYFGNSPQGMSHQRQMQQRNASIGDQNGEIHSSLPAGTKLQGHVETVKEAFGFIRVPTAAEPIFFHISNFHVYDRSITDEGKPGSAPQQVQQDSSAAPLDPDQQPALQVLSDDSAPPGLESSNGQTGRQDLGLFVSYPNTTKKVLSQLVQPGQPVEFTVSASSHDKVKHRGGRASKYMAKEVRILPMGTFQIPENGKKPIQGRIERPLVSGSSNQSWTNREEVGKTEGLISYQKEGASAAEDRQQLFVTFSEANLKARGLRFSRGDMVEFMLRSNPETGRQTASQIGPARQARAYVEPSGPKEQGFVARFQDTFGFIRSLDRDMHQQLFFHQSEVHKEPGQAITPGAEVSFSLAPDTQGKGEGNPMAVHVQLLPEGTLEAEKRLPVRMKGQVTRPCAAKERTDTGKLAYEDEQGSTRVCTFLLDQVEDGEEVRKALDTGDQVEFSVLLNRKLGTSVAESVKLLCKAEDKRELGQVKQVHGKGEECWGFIKACERSQDLFFHGSQLQDILPSDLKQGDDVEFCVARDPAPDNPKRIVGTRITRAPKGSAAFDVISEQQYHGVVLDRMVKSKNNISSGLLHYDDSGSPAKLTFGPKDLSDQSVNPKIQDHVTFRTCINPRAVKAAEKVGGAAAQYAGRRATQVALPVHTGRVQHVLRSHGFLEWQAGGESQPRIFYQAFDVEGNAELCKGDEVTFTVADKLPRKEAEKAGMTDIPIIARRICCTKEAAVKEDLPAPAERNPAAVKYTGNLGQAPGAPKGVRIAKGPDGSKGFLPGRGRPLPPQPATMPQPAPGSVPSLKTALSSGSLNPTAAEFVPGGLSAMLTSKVVTVGDQLRSPSPAVGEAPKPPKGAAKASEKVSSTDQPSSAMGAQQKESNCAEQIEPDQGHTEASAAANGQHSKQEGDDVVGKGTVAQEVSLAPGVGEPDQANGSTPESTPLATTEAELSGNAQPQMVAANDMQAQTTETDRRVSSGETAAAVTANDEPHSVAGLGKLTQALQDSHIDPEKDLAIDAAPAKVSSSEQRSASAEEQDSDSKTMNEAANSVGVDSSKAETIATGMEESHAAAADAAPSKAGEKREEPSAETSAAGPI